MPLDTGALKPSCQARPPVPKELLAHVASHTVISVRVMVMTATRTSWDDRRYVGYPVPANDGLYQGFVLWQLHTKL